jgi:hypothetical protein
MFLARGISFLYWGIAFWDWVLNKLIFEDHLPNYAILACRSAKKELVFCEKNAISTFRSIIIY